MRDPSGDQVGKVSQGRLALRAMACEFDRGNWIANEPSLRAMNVILHASAAVESPGKVDASARHKSASNTTVSALVIP